MPRDDKVAILKESLAAIGKRIEFVLEQKGRSGEDVTRWRRHLWTFVTLFWPKKVKAAKLEEIHAKMVMKESSGAPRAGSSDMSTSASKKPRLGSVTASSGRNGASSSHTNGNKFHPR